MMANPRAGQAVLIWYRPILRDHMPLHGKPGTVVIASHGKPRNHAVRVDGSVYIVPCGNLQKKEPDS